MEVHSFIYEKSGRLDMSSLKQLYEASRIKKLVIVSIKVQVNWYASYKHCLNKGCKDCIS